LLLCRGLNYIIMTDSVPVVNGSEAEQITAVEIDEILYGLCGEQCSEMCERFVADDCSLALKVLAFVMTSMDLGHSHVAAERCLCTALFCCTSEQHRLLVTALARSSGIFNWVFGDILGTDMNASAAAIDFLTVFCGREEPLPPSVASLLDRNTVSIILEAILGTEGMVGRDEDFSPMCRSAVLALCALYHQIYLSEKKDSTDDPLEYRLAMNRALSVILLHPSTEDGHISQVFALFANRCLSGLNPLLFCIFCRFIGDLCSSAAVAYSVIFQQDLLVLASILVKNLEDLDPCSPDPRRISVLYALDRMFSDRSVRLDMPDEVSHLHGTLEYLIGNYDDDG